MIIPNYNYNLSNFLCDTVNVRNRIYDTLSLLMQGARQGSATWERP